MRKRSFLAATAFAAAVVMVFGGAPAGATVVERGHYSDSYSFSYDDCGFDVVVEGTASGHFRIRAGKGKTDSAFFVNDNFSYTETHTNPDTGAFLTTKGNAVFNEIRATRLEGNIFEFALRRASLSRFTTRPATSCCATGGRSITASCSIRRAMTYRAECFSRTSVPMCMARIRASEPTSVRSSLP
jgi:hypothetical protein